MLRVCRPHTNRYDASNTAEMEDIVQSLKDSELDQAAGLATTDLVRG